MKAYPGLVPTLAMLAAMTAAQATSSTDSAATGDGTPTTLNSYGILGVLVGTMAVHVMAEFAGVDTGGYFTTQLVIALATRGCAAAALQSAFNESLYIVDPLRFWMSRADPIALIGPGVLCLGSLALYGLLSALAAGATAAIGGQATERSGVFQQAARLLRWPSWSVFLLRVNLLPCVLYAARQLSLGSNLPDSNGSSDGLFAAGVVAAVAVLLVYLIAIPGLVQTAVRSNPRWLWYGGPNVNALNRHPLPLAHTLTADGFWSEAGEETASVAIAGAAPVALAVGVVNLYLPLIFAVLAAFVGISWDSYQGADCRIPYIFTFVTLLAAILVPVVVLRPFRHSFANVFCIIRVAAAAVVALSQFGIASLQDSTQNISVGIYLAVDVFSALVTLAFTLIERVLWRPGEVALRTERLRQTLLLNEVRSYLSRTQSPAEVEETISSLPQPRLESMLSPDTLVRIHDAVFNESRAATEAPLIASSRTLSRNLTEPLLRMPSAERIERNQNSSSSREMSPLPVEPALRSPNPIEAHNTRSGSQIIRPSSLALSFDEQRDPLQNSRSIVFIPPAAVQPIERVATAAPAAEGGGGVRDPFAGFSFTAGAQAPDGDEGAPSPDPFGPQSPGTSAVPVGPHDPSLFHELDTITSAIANFPTIPWTRSFNDSSRYASTAASRRRIRFDDDPLL